jgi:hypothetical protein
MARGTYTFTLFAALVLLMAGQALAADDWGAIAVDLGKYEKSPLYGIGGGASEDEASGNAMKFCIEAGGTHCKLQTTYQQCGAYAASQTSGGWGKAPTKKTAEIQALGGCGEDACKIVTSDCNEGSK